MGRGTSGPLGQALRVDQGDGQGRRGQSTLDRWAVNACMMSTTATRADANGFLLSWQGRENVAAAVIDDTGRIAQRFEAPGRGRNRKHSIAARNPRGTLCLAWTEGTGWMRGGELRWQCFAADGSAMVGAESTGGRDDLPAWSLPAIAVHGADFTIFY